jgi:hypothetical protein
MLFLYFLKVFSFFYTIFTIFIVLVILPNSCPVFNVTRISWITIIIPNHLYVPFMYSVKRSAYLPYVF